MPLYGGFDPQSVETIEEAFQFVLEQIKYYYQTKMFSVGEPHEKLIEKEYLKERKRLEQALDLASKKIETYGVYELSEKANSHLMSLIRSALEAYLKDTQKAKKRTGLTVFDTKIQEMKRVIDLEGPKAGDPTLFKKYFESPGGSIETKKTPDSTTETKRIKIFLSYSTEDKALAGKIANSLERKGVDVFLAHEKIKISDKWRNEILRHLKSDSIMIALLTENYEKSVWTNQEAGYMIGQKKKIIPLIVRQSDITKFGFLETYQGIFVTEEKIEDCIEKIIFAITK